MGQTGTGAENRREEMSHITAVNRVLVKILLEQLHSNTVCFSEKMFLLLLLYYGADTLKGLKGSGAPYIQLSYRRDKKVLRSGGDISCFLRLLLGCFLASVLVWLLLF